MRASDRSAPCSPTRFLTVHTLWYDVCMFQEVCPGAMVMHSGVVVGPVSSNFAYPTFIRSWSGGFICIRNSRSGQEFSLLDLSPFFSPLSRDNKTCSPILTRWEIIEEKESHRDERRKGRRLRKSSTKGAVKFRSLFIVDFVNSG